MSKALQHISKLPFVRRINRVRLPHRFSQSMFAIYNGRADPVEHVSHFMRPSCAKCSPPILDLWLCVGLMP